MTTKALFMTSMGGPKMPMGLVTEFTRTASDVLTATVHGLQTGAGPYKMMTTDADAPAGLVASVRSSLVYTPSTDIEDETVTVDTKLYTWKDVPGNTDGTVDVDAAAAAASDNLANAINLGPNAGTDYGRDTVGNPNVRATSLGGTVLVEAKVLDATIGDAIAVAEAAAGAWAGAGTVLANGADGTDYFIIRLTANTFSVATSKANAIAGTVVSITDAGTGVHTLVPTVETLAEAQEDVLVNFLTASGAKSYPADLNISNFWQTSIDGVASNDG